MTSWHVEDLDRCVGRGIWLEFYDPDAERYPLPTYPYRMAPGNLVTRRQLRSAGLRPGGQDIQAQILWRHHGATRRQNGIRLAYLYDKDQAKPKRIATPAVLASVSKALTARKTCPTCRQVQEYCIPKSQGECNPCADAARGIQRQPEPQAEPESQAQHGPEISWFDMQRGGQMVPQPRQPQRELEMQPQ